MVCIATEVTSTQLHFNQRLPASDADTVAEEYRCEILDEWGNTRDLYSYHSEMKAAINIALQLLASGSIV